MPVTEHARNEIVGGNPLEFPAVQAWNVLWPERVDPERVEIRLLKRKSRSEIYRLAGVRPSRAGNRMRRLRPG